MRESTAATPPSWRAGGPATHATSTTRNLFRPAQRHNLTDRCQLPRDKVIELFDNPQNLFKWQPGLQSFEHISGTPGQPGAKSKLVSLNGERRIELIQTITKRNLPDEYDGTYEWDGGMNTVQNRFIELGPDRTKWVSTSRYDCTGFMMKLMMFLFGAKFREHNMTILRNFKAYCEEGRDVRASGGS